MNDRLRTVLIVEDEPIIAMDMADALNRAGWTVIGPAGTIKQAEAAIAKEYPTVAVLDINLGSVSTFPIAERLHASDVPVAFLTGQANMDLPPVLNGAKVFSKPAAMDDLVAHLEALAG